MTLGPVDYIAIAFPGNNFSGMIIPAKGRESCRAAAWMQ